MTSFKASITPTIDQIADSYEPAMSPDGAKGKKSNMVILFF